MRAHHLLFSLLLFLLSSPANAQSDTLSMRLKEVEIKADKNRFSSIPGAFTCDTSIIGMMTARTLAEILNRESGFFIKSYGPGALSTITQRGSAATQNALFWCGLPLNSPMLGLYDLSLLPAFLLDEVRVEPGGNGTISGNSSIGGTLSMDNKINNTQGWSTGVLTGVGSFGEQQFGLNLETGSFAFQSRTRVYFSTSKNDFMFTDPEGKSKRQNHARYEQKGFTQDLSWGNQRNKLDIHLWHLESFREIPPHMLSVLSLQEQADASSRGVLSWTVNHETNYFRIRIGVSEEKIRYTDAIAEIDDKSRALVLQSDAEAGWILNRHLRLQSQILWNNSTADSDGYPKSESQEQGSLAAKLVYETTHSESVLSFRQTIFDGGMLPILPGFSHRTSLGRGHSLFAEFAGIYRIPTLNDRFWSPGGNPDLLPESGWSSSIGSEWEIKKLKLNFKARGAIFCSVLKNAILWSPNTTGLYTAENVSTLISKGIEADFNFRYRIGDWQAGFSFSPDYTIAVTGDPADLFSISDEKQLVYTPKVLYKLGLTAAYHSFSIRYYHQYTGYRYTTTDHAHYLRPFDVAELILAYDGKMWKQQCTLTAGIRNLFDENYQVMAWRAMPGRSFQIAMYLRFGRNHRS